MSHTNIFFFDIELSHYYWKALIYIYVLIYAYVIWRMVFFIKNLACTSPETKKSLDLPPHLHNQEGEQYDSSICGPQPWRWYKLPSVSENLRTGYTGIHARCEFWLNSVAETQFSWPKPLYSLWIISVLQDYYTQCTKSIQLCSYIYL